MTDVFEQPSSMPDLEELPDGTGVSFLAVDGRRVVMIGVGPKDRVFRSEKFGLLNVSRAIDAIRTEKRRPAKTKIDEALINHIKFVDIDLKYVFEMPEEQSDEPIIMVIASDGTNIIDGHHRLKRRIFDRKSFVKVHILRPETVRYMQVKVFKEDEKGTLQPMIGMTEDALEAEIKGGSQMADKMYAMNRSK